MAEALARHLSSQDEGRLREALHRTYPPGTFTDDVAEVEVHTRQFWFQNRYTPWIESVMPLNGARVLELGAGTGTSGIPLAQRGAHVTSVDLNAAGLGVAAIRARLHGLADRVETVCMDAALIGERFAGQTFDLVVYFASLEHMTHAERMASLAGAWGLLKPGGWLSICDSPNRLWFYDNHTSLQNFFHWLPDELASAYAMRTPREGFNASVPCSTTLARWGRGVSYHDFEVALGLDVRDLDVRGEWEYRRAVEPEWAAGWLEEAAGLYHQFLKATAPDLPVAFCEEEIAVMIKKPAKFPA